jgi:putative inorganic carbon (HCO3(-)) transporter
MGKTKSTTYENLYKFIVLFLPLIFSTSTNEGYEFPKTFFLYFVGLLTLTIFLTEVILKSKKINFGNIWVYLYLGTFLISTVFSVHPYTSLWGYYTRFNGGFFSVIALFSLYFVAINVFNRLEIQKILRFSIFTIIPISIYGVAQYIGNVPLLWSSESLGRVSSTIGQPNWLAQYMVFVLPMCLYFAFLEHSLWLTGLYLLGFLGFWLTFSLSGFLGFGVALCVLLFVFYKKKMFTRDNNIRLGIVFACMLLVMGTNLGFLQARFNDVIQDMKKVLSTVVEVKVYAQDKSDIKRVSDTGLIRFGIWKGIFQQSLSSPKNFLIGTGPETFPYTFQPYRPLDLNYSSEWEFVFNKPHNYYLELLAEQGIFSLAIWSVLFFLIFKKSPAYMRPGIIGFAITNFFGWPVTSTELFFWLLLAFSGTKKDA